ncbi:hypothetical protein [Nocardia suismassiliense]|uniref:hypothetical protein n=1 Tax=Nocardia suismassiliense TaxID=2077092 RepID=UPI00131F2C4A|nr:hypothetical protein [Nocardia suismassiliense]
MAEDLIAQLAIDSWQSHGLTCVICPTWTTLAAYVRIPEGHVDEVDLKLVDVTYGPDARGWVGFDTRHVGSYWAPDDLMPYIDAGLWSYLAEEARIAQTFPGGGHRWTLTELREATDRLALALSGQLR